MPNFLKKRVWSVVLSVLLAHAAVLWALTIWVPAWRKIEQPPQVLAVQVITPAPEATPAPPQTLPTPPTQPAPKPVTPAPTARAQATSPAAKAQPPTPTPAPTSAPAPTPQATPAPAPNTSAAPSDSAASASASAAATASPPSIAPSAPPPAAAAQPPQNAKVELPLSDAAYLSNPAPPYPPLSRSLGEQGLVEVQVMVGADGKPEQALLKTSSGFERLDKTAVATAMRWRYVPGKRGGVPEAMWATVPMRFSLNN
jgi:periplasmic protein TonB